MVSSEYDGARRRWRAAVRRILADREAAKPAPGMRVDAGAHSEDVRPGGFGKRVLVWLEYLESVAVPLTADRPVFPEDWTFPVAERFVIRQSAFEIPRLAIVRAVRIRVGDGVMVEVPFYRSEDEPDEVDEPEFAIEHAESVPVFGAVQAGLEPDLEFDWKLRAIAELEAELARLRRLIHESETHVAECDCDCHDVRVRPRFAPYQVLDGDGEVIHDFPGGDEPDTSCHCGHPDCGAC